MPWTLSSNNSTESQKTIVREHFLVKLSFSTPVYLSSRQDITFDSQAYTGADMRLELDLDGSRGSLQFLDEDFSDAGKFIAQGTAG